MYYIGNVYAWQPISFLIQKKLRFTAHISVVRVSFNSAYGLKYG